MPRNQYEIMNLLIALTKCALLYKLAGGSDRIVSTSNAIYYIGTILHSWSFHRTKEWLRGLHNVEKGYVRKIKPVQRVASSTSKPRLHHLHPSGFFKFLPPLLYHSLLHF